MARVANYDKKIASIQEKINKKQDELKNLRTQLKELENQRNENAMSELADFMKSNNMSIEEVMAKLNQ